MPTRSAGDPGHRGERIARISHRASRGLTIAALVVIVISPLLVTIREGGAPWFTWRMFSDISAEVTYEVERDEWTARSIDDLGWWDRGAHTGTGNLEVLCREDADISAARRLINGEVDAQVTCS